MRNKTAIGLLSCLVIIPLLAACSPATTDTGTTGPSSGNENVINSYATEDTVLGLAAGEDYLWATTSSGVIRLNLKDGREQKYTTEDGLSSDNVREIISDSRGNIWVTCYCQGVCRFNGEEWDSFNVNNGLCSNDTITLAADEKGGVWVSAYWGVSYYDGQQWSSYSNIDPDAVVIGDENPMKDCRNLEFVDAELAAVDVIYVDSQGNVWFSDRGYGVSRFDGKYWHMFTSEDGVAKGGVSAIMEDKDGNLWFGSSTGGMTSFDGAEFTSYTIDDYQSIVPRPVIMDIIQDSRGDIWAATHGGGVVRLSGNDQRVFRTEDGLPDYAIRGLFLGKDGYPGVITDNGVSCFDGNAWQPLSSADGVPEGKVRLAVKDSQGRLWFGAEKGVSRYL